MRVDERTGEVSLQLGQSLDRETATHLHALAIPVDGSDPITIRVEILDENDNVPMFPVESVKAHIELGKWSEKIIAKFRWKFPSMPGSTQK